ncbi:hypothetical protein SSS_09972 [Sarcoptes scabiei]|uniref:SWIM-type domain-containing protein n=1 Tax=Sarcoptes scabiei TaxID=52283 RepID=A0A834VEM5_SARSC|nr:hypothetical protein SSS_09972 [Sarcoptes scabiei]UXI16016.1 ADP-ribosylation factor GTPase-activating protein 2 [Sarcoptes scabiei]
MSSISERLFNLLLNKLSSSNNKLTGELIEEFFGLFGEIWLDCLMLINERTIKKLTTSSGKYLVKVFSEKILFKEQKSKNNSARIEYHYCLVNGNYCNCIQFLYDGLIQDELLWCKHLIAAKLALAMGRYENILIDDQEYNEICMNTIMKVQTS